MRFIERTYVTSDNGLKYYENNRCFTNEASVCNDLGFSPKDIAIFNRRVTKILKSIKDFNYLDCCEIKVFKLEETYYVGDGQGRLYCISKLNETRNEADLIRIPCLVYEVDSEAEMSEAIRGMNMCNTNWNQTDNIRCQIRTSQNPNLIDKLNKVNQLIKYLGINNSNACDMLLGQGSRKRDVNWEERPVWEDVDDFAAWVHDIYDFCYRNDWTQAELSKLKSQKFLEVLKEYIYRRCKRHCGLHLNDVKELIKEKIAYTDKDNRNVFSNDRDFLRNLLVNMINKSKKRNMKEVFAILSDYHNR